MSTNSSKESSSVKHTHTKKRHEAAADATELRETELDDVQGGDGRKKKGGSLLWYDGFVIN